MMIKTFNRTTVECKFSYNGRVTRYTGPLIELQ